jgi:hypothetical protein
MYGWGGIATSVAVHFRFLPRVQEYSYVGSGTPVRRRETVCLLGTFTVSS